MKTHTAYLAIACVAAVACTEANPAFRAEALGPYSDRRGERLPDAALPLDIDADAERTEPAVDAPQMARPEDAAQDLGSEASGDVEVADGAADGGVEVAGSDSTLAMGIVAHYPLDLVGGTSVADVTGTRAGTMHGGAGWTSVGFEAAQFANGGALVLDGTSGYVTLPATGLPTVAGSKSVSFWFWQPAPNSSVRKTLLSLSNPDQMIGLQLGLQVGVPSLWLWGQLIGTALVADDRPSPAGWTHLAFVQQGSALRLYVNGALADSTAIGLPSVPVTSFMLGGYAATGGEDELWNGRLDDVRIYGRALSAAEVAALAAGAF